VDDPLLPGLIAVLAGTALVVVGFVPFVARSYRRRGRLDAGHAVLAAASVVYAVALVAYVLLPLPDDPLACAAIAPQLQPLRFVDDIRREGGPLLGDPAVLQVLFNVALFVPFGALVRHLGRRPVALTVVAGFVVSLAIELTQLTGDWFVYPCPYRLFDVDDLLANTAGALLGALSAPVLRLVPGQPTAPDPGLARPVTTGRRLLGVACDLVGVVLLGVVLVVPLHVVLLAVGPQPWQDAVESAASTWVPWTLWFVIVPMTGDGGTPGQRAVLLRPAATDGRRLAPPHLLARSLAGTGGFMLLEHIGGAAVGLAVLCGAAGLVGIPVTAGHRGLGGALTGTTVLDRRLARPLLSAPGETHGT
jgi:glycopeptide antibiotics resistance protein/uncharacterized RDD family membrane protein YckC